METLRKILYVIIAMFLGIFINLFSLTLIAKNVIQDEIITNTIKTSIVSGYLSKNIKEIDELPEDKKKMLEEFLNDNEINEVVDVLIDNYVNYQGDTNHKISQDDVDKIKNYIVKHEDMIKQIGGKNIDIDEITKDITVDNIDKNAKEAVESFDDFPADIKPVFSSYKYITVGPAKMVLAGLIVFCLALMMLISWSLVKWMKATGVCLITNGVLITLMYIFIDGIKDLILKAINLGISMNNVSFNNILIIGLSELGIGILLVIIHKVLSNKKNNFTKKELIKDAEKVDEEDIQEV